jgi:glycerol-3-phosphate dehydrogenase (NAD(P)+)
MPIHFAILGDGAWGTAIALLLAGNPEHRVALWSALTEAVHRADLLIAAVPTVYLRPTLRPVAGALGANKPVLSLAKGLENETFLRPTEILQELLGVDRVAVLSGPSHAEEVSRGRPTTVVAASTDLDLARWIQQRFSTDRFRVYTNLDVAGVELGGALKNIIGIAAGISDGLGFGDNAKSALLTRGLVEMARFGVALGAEHATFFGLAGLGDLVTTCISRHGRNRHVGERLARGEKLGDILPAMKMVAEGVYTTRSVHDKAARMGIDMPITQEVYRVLYEGKDPLAAVNDLMLREPKREKIA